VKKGREASSRAETVGKGRVKDRENTPGGEDVRSKGFEGKGDWEALLGGKGRKE